MITSARPGEAAPFKNTGRMLVGPGCDVDDLPPLSLGVTRTRNSRMVALQVGYRLLLMGSGTGLAGVEDSADPRRPKRARPWMGNGVFSLEVLLGGHSAFVSGRWLCR